MAQRRWVLVLLLAGAQAIGLLSCSSSSPRDINYGTLDGADFTAPASDTGSGTPETGGSDGSNVDGGASSDGAGA
jgi:hypothetical protein